MWITSLPLSPCLSLSPLSAWSQASPLLTSHSPKRGTEKSDCPHLNPTYGGNFGHKERHTSTSFLTGFSPRLLCKAACGELCTFTLDVAVASLVCRSNRATEAAAAVHLQTAGLPSPIGPSYWVRLILLFPVIVLQLLSNPNNLNQITNVYIDCFSARCDSFSVVWLQNKEISSEINEMSKS